MGEWTAPGDRFPATAGVRITLPETWVPVQVAGAVLAAERPTDSTQYPPATLTIEVRRVVPGALLSEAVQRFRAEMSEYPEAVVSREGDIGASAGLSVYGHEMAYVAAGVGTVLQSTRLALVEGSLVVIQATVGGNRVDSDYVEVQQALPTVVITP